MEAQAATLHHQRLKKLRLNHSLQQNCAFLLCVCCTRAIDNIININSNGAILYSSCMSFCYPIKIGFNTIAQFFGEVYRFKHQVRSRE